MSDATESSNIDIVRDVIGLHVDSERLETLLAAYADVLVEIEKLRALELTDVQPAVIFHPSDRGRGA